MTRRQKINLFRSLYGDLFEDFDRDVQIELAKRFDKACQDHKDFFNQIMEYSHDTRRDSGLSS
jgi:hypothetical protein